MHHPSHWKQTPISLEADIGQLGKQPRVNGVCSYGYSARAVLRRDQKLLVLVQRCAEWTANLYQGLSSFTTFINTLPIDRQQAKSLSLNILHILSHCRQTMAPLPGDHSHHPHHPPWHAFVSFQLRRPEGLVPPCRLLEDLALEKRSLDRPLHHAFLA